MLLTPKNSTNPAFWGKDMVQKDGKVLLIDFKDCVPKDTDFINTFFPKDPQGAKEYFNYKK